MRKYILILVPLLLLHSQLLGQNESGKTTQSAGHYIYLGEGDELLMNVQIWGQVKNPGLYSLPEESDIATLLSLAGGPTEHADLSGIKIMRKGSEKDSLFTINLKKAMLGGEKEKTMLMPGDIVEVMPSKFHSFSTFVRFVTQVTMVVAIYYQIFGQ
jgi:protein involved in polysaccharide export with SLBB domain